LFTPVLSGGVVLVDGGLVNPVPVSLARAMGADMVIAVDLGTDILGRHLRNGHPHAEPAGAFGDWFRRLLGDPRGHASASPVDEPTLPPLPMVVATSINIMQVRIASCRAAQDPPDVTVAPQLAHLRLLDFHRASEAIEEGHRAVQRATDTLARLTAPPEA
jgi:NTE family protein